jgi:hypothetical protein
MTPVLNTIISQMRQGNPVHPEDAALAISNDVNGLFAFMVDNNPAAINNVLKNEMGIESLPFAPDVKAISAQLDMLVKKGDSDSLNKVIRGFKFNRDAGNYTTFPPLVNKLKEFLTGKNK